MELLCYATALILFTECRQFQQFTDQIIAANSFITQNLNTYKYMHPTTSVRPFLSFQHIWRNAE